MRRATAHFVLVAVVAIAAAGALIALWARDDVLDAGEEERAEAALKANYGLGRALYEGMSGPLGVDTVYLEVTPHVP